MAHSPELKKRAQELRKQGLLMREIAVDLGVPKPTIVRWLNPELETRERKKARKRKFSASKKCSMCRSRRCADSSTLCRVCYRKRGQRVWTQERLIEAVKEWALEHGNPPSFSDWQRSGGDKHPAVRSITDGPHPPFKTWGALLEAAGFEPGVRRNRRGKLTPTQKKQRADLRRQVREERIKLAVLKGEQS